MASIGYIPKKVIIVSSGSGFHERWKLDPIIDTDEFVPGFAVPLESRTRLRSAHMWAARRRGKKDTDIIKEEKYDNSPMTLKIVALEYRSNGGRAYKVVDQRNYLFDMREDVVIEAMLNVGVEPGGKLGGQYIWGVLGSSTRIIRLDSNLYNQLKESSQVRFLKPIKLKDLEPHTFYENRQGDLALFVNFISTSGWNYWSGKEESLNKAMLWLYIHRRRTELSNAELVEMYLNGEGHGLTPEIKKTHSFVQKIEGLADIPVGDGMIYAIRDRCRKELDGQLDDAIIFERKHMINSRIRRYGMVCNMEPYGKKPGIYRAYIP